MPYSKVFTRMQEKQSYSEVLQFKLVKNHLLILSFKRNVRSNHCKKKPEQRRKELTSWKRTQRELENSFKEPFLFRFFICLSVVSSR